MSKTVRSLIIAAVVLAVLAVTYVVLTRTAPATEDPVPTASEEPVESEAPASEKMYVHEEADFVEVEVTQFDGAVFHVKKDGGDFVVPELASVDYYHTAPQTLAKRMTAFPYAVKVAESASEEELASYGFGSTPARAVVTFKDGSSETVYVGDKGDDGYYLRREGDPAVYAGSEGIAVTFRDGYLSYVKTTLFYCAEDYRTGVDEFELVDAATDDPLRIAKCRKGTASALALSSTYCMTFPCFMGTDDEALDTGLTELAGFAGEAVVALVDESTDLSAYGLDAPRLTLRFTYQQPAAEGEETNNNPVEKYEFLISDALEDGTRYILNNEKTMVMTLPDGVYSFLSWDMVSMAGPVFLSPLIKYIDRVVVTSAGREYRFDLTITDGSLSAVKYADRQLDVDNFKKFYQVILGTSWAGVGRAEEGAEETMSIRFVYQSDLEKEDDVMTLRPFSLRQYAIEINGTGRFTVPKTRVDKLASDLQKVINNEPVTAYMN